jgi:N-acetylneuraminate synthase
MTHVEIGKARIGPGCPVYVIAEVSANHQQRYEWAVELLRAARDAGADAVKLQTYTPETLTIAAETEYFRIGGGTLWDGRTLYDLYREAHMPWDWQPKLKELAKDLGLELFSTAYDTTAADFLESMGVAAYKIASFENVDLPLIDYVARKGKPMIISTGMASLAEIEEAVAATRAAGAPLVLLKCTSSYPAPPEDMNLRTIPHLAEAFDLPVGLSDHSEGIAVPIAAVALGACMVEKHMTLSRADGGPDGPFSLEPAEFRAMVDGIRQAERALGQARYGPAPHERKSLAFRRSLFVVEDVKAGELLTEANVRAIRPGHGLAPKFRGEVIGRRAVVNIARGTPIGWDLLGERAR